MKFLFSSFKLAAALALLSISSCGRLGEDSFSGTGSLSVYLADGSGHITKAYPDLPDTCDFHLSISSSKGERIYDGPYGECRETLDVPSGNYVISIRSSEFSKPAFNSPQFGDEQCVSVAAGGHSVVKLVCGQINAGIRLYISSSFREENEDAVLLLKSAEGSLMYSFAEKRTAYFKPGLVSVVMSRGAEDQVLMVRDLNARDMLGVSLISAVQQTGKDGLSVSVDVDTSRVWRFDELLAGESSPGDAVGDAMGVAQARNSAPDEDVWVTGYIVGGDLTSASASFSMPFKSATNVLLGPRAAVSDRSSCLAVQLPDNEVRELLNLVDNPEMLGKRVCVRGDLVSSYYGMPGMKNTSECVVL